MTDVRRIRRSEGSFTVPELDWNNSYYAGMLDGAPYVWLHVQSSPGLDFVMLHLALRGFSRRIRQELLADFATVRALFRAAGTRKIFVMKAFPFRTWERLIKMLGFDVPYTVHVAGTGCKAVVMEVN